MKHIQKTLTWFGTVAYFPPITFSSGKSMVREVENDVSRGINMKQKIIYFRSFLIFTQFTRHRQTKPPFLGCTACMQSSSSSSKKEKFFSSLKTKSIFFLRWVGRGGGGVVWWQCMNGTVFSFVLCWFCEELKDGGGDT